MRLRLTFLTRRWRLTVSIAVAVPTIVLIWLWASPTTDFKIFVHDRYNQPNPHVRIEIDQAPPMYPVFCFNGFGTKPWSS